MALCETRVYVDGELVEVAEAEEGTILFARFDGEPIQFIAGAGDLRIRTHHRSKSYEAETTAFSDNRPIRGTVSELLDTARSLLHWGSWRGERHEPPSQPPCITPVP